MATTAQIVPESEVYLTAEELDDPENEIIFVQHAEEIDRNQIKENLEHYLAKHHGKNMTLREVPESPCYPIAFGNGEMKVSKKFDKYIVALPRRK